MGVRFPFLLRFSGRVSHVLFGGGEVSELGGVAITQVCGFEVITQCVIKILIALGFFSAKAVRVININPKMFKKQSRHNAKHPQQHQPTTNNMAQTMRQ